MTYPTNPKAGRGFTVTIGKYKTKEAATSAKVTLRLMGVTCCYCRKQEYKICSFRAEDEVYWTIYCGYCLLPELIEDDDRLPELIEDDDELIDENE